MNENTENESWLHFYSLEMFLNREYREMKCILQNFFTICFLNFHLRRVHRSPLPLPPKKNKNKTQSSIRTTNKTMRQVSDWLMTFALKLKLRV